MGHCGVWVTVVYGSMWCMGHCGIRNRYFVGCVNKFGSVLHRMSLDLVETLLNIAETGNFDEVLHLFSAPLKQCPEILFFGLLQAKVRLLCVAQLPV